MKKFLALLLALVMVMSLAACVSDPTPTEPSTTPTGPNNDPTTEPTTEPTNPPVTLNVDRYPLESDKTFTVVTQSNLFENGQTLITEAMEKATGVSIEWQYLTADQFKMALTGGEMPDATFLFGGLDKAKVYEYGQANYFVNFMDYLDLMPNFAALIEAHPEYLAVVQNEDGSVYCLPQILTTTTGVNNMIYYRTDMMEAIGWDAPPATTDEFVQFLRELQEHFGATDPDFIAFNGYQPNYMEWDIARFPNFFFSSFGELVQTGLTVNSNDEVVLGAATEQFKHYLEFMNELWNLGKETGAFNTNVYTQDGTASKALSAENHVAVVPVTSGFSLKNFESGNFDLEVMAPLTSEYWDTQHWFMAPTCKWGRITLLSSKCEDIETMVKWFDAWYAPVDDPLNAEGTVFGITPWLGEFGVDYDFNEETMVYTENEHEGIDMGKFASTQGFSTVLYCGFENGLFPYSQAPNTAVGVKGHGTVKNLWPYAVTPVDVLALSLTVDENDIYVDAWADIDQYLDQMTAKFITGELSIDEYWDEYLAELEKMDLQDVLDVFQDAYDRTKG